VTNGKEPASDGLLSRVFSRATGVVVDAVDPDLIIDQVDVNALMERVDVNALLDRVDPQVLLDNVDVNTLMDRVDIDALLDRVDVNDVRPPTASSDGIPRSALCLHRTSKQQLESTKKVTVR
jgi:hypothetical protein